MIGCITTGQRFKPLIDYLLKPNKEPEIIGGCYYGETAEQINRDFELVAAQRPTTKKPVKHFVISFAPEDEEIDERTKYKIAKETVAMMGYDCNQWIAVAHRRDDPDHYEAHHHDHLHVAVNMITYAGERVRDGWDKFRMRKVLRELEQKYGLKQTAPAYTSTRLHPKQGRYKRFEKAYYKYLDALKTFTSNAKDRALPTPPREPEIQELETFVRAACDDKPTMTEYLARMQYLGYRVEQYQGKVSKRTNKPRQRFRYYLKCNGKAICKINGGSRAQLIKYGVDYIPERDDPNIAKAARGEPIEIPQHRLVTEAQVAKYQYGWLNKDKRKRLQQAIAQMTGREPPVEQKQTKNQKPDLEL